MLEDLNQSDRDLVARSLDATVNGSFFPEWEFQTLFGLTRDEVRSVLAAFPEIDGSSTLHALAINNALNHLTGYPHNSDDELRSYGLDRNEVVRVHKLLRDRLRRVLRETA